MAYRNSRSTTGQVTASTSSERLERSSSSSPEATSAHKTRTSRKRSNSRAWTKVSRSDEPRKGLKTYPWNPAEHIKTEKDVIAYLSAALEDGDPKVVAAMLGYIARSKGMANVAKKA